MALTIRNVLNNGDPAQLPTAQQKLALGELLGVMLATQGDASVPSATVGAAVTQTSTNPSTPSASQVASMTSLVTNDIQTLTARVNQLRVDVLAIRGVLAGMTGVTEQGVTVASNTCTLAASASAVFNVVGITGTVTGVFKLIPGNQTPVTGEVAWNGDKVLTFASADAVTSVDVTYAKADGSQKASILLADYAPLG